jgi:S-adenosylmethionine:tRNA ribosyltransferase-isomerase
MKDILKDIDIDDYDYELPEDKVAQYPVKDRDTSLMLLYNKGSISKDIFRNIDQYLPENSLLVFNNTKVIRARLLFQKETGATIEIFCIEPLMPVDYQKSFGSTDPIEWKCIIGNLKKWKDEKLFLCFIYKGIRHNLSAQRIKEEGDAWRVRFEWTTDELSFGEIIGIAGHIPLPPYVKREDEYEDNIRYQTVYSKKDGSVAAPTAGLHFTNDVLNNISKRGIKSVEVTLHIGAGTFQPVRTNDVARHEMHCEHFFVNKEVIEELLRFRGRIIAVGTTSVRTLESIHWLGVKMIKNQYNSDKELSVGQWEPYGEENDISAEESMAALLDLFNKRNVLSLHASTKIMIVPGYKFMVINGMITNFHQPKSTLLLLVSAWVGEEWKKIYSFAMENNFRFLSFGDSSLLMK